MSVDKSFAIFPFTLILPVVTSSSTFLLLPRPAKAKNLFKEEKSNENMSADSINARYAYRESPSNEKLARIIGGLLNAKKNKGL